MPSSCCLAEIDGPDCLERLEQKTAKPDDVPHCTWPRTFGQAKGVHHEGREVGFARGV
jgi:hypothetical protein